MGLVSGIIIHQYEDKIPDIEIFKLYMPMVADTGGYSNRYWCSTATDCKSARR